MSKYKCLRLRHKGTICLIEISQYTNAKWIYVNKKNVFGSGRWITICCINSKQDTSILWAEGLFSWRTALLADHVQQCHQVYQQKPHHWQNHEMATESVDTPRVKQVNTLWISRLPRVITSQQWLHHEINTERKKERETERKRERKRYLTYTGSLLRLWWTGCHLQCKRMNCG